MGWSDAKTFTMVFTQTLWILVNFSMLGLFEHVEGSTCIIFSHYIIFLPFSLCVPLPSLL